MEYLSLEQITLLIIVEESVEAREEYARRARLQYWKDAQEREQIMARQESAR